MLGMSIPRLLVNVAGASLGLIVSERYVTANWSSPENFLGLPIVSGSRQVGWDDITDAGLALAGAAAANMLLSRFGK